MQHLDIQQVPSVTIFRKKRYFSGDTLFYESYGRTDLATGSSSDIADSLLNKLFVLPEDTMVYPGHGDQLPLAMKRSTILFRITDKYERGTIDRKQEENDRIINTG